MAYYVAPDRITRIELTDSEYNYQFDIGNENIKGFINDYDKQVRIIFEDGRTPVLINLGDLIPHSFTDTIRYSIDGGEEQTFTRGQVRYFNKRGYGQITYTFSYQAYTESGPVFTATATLKYFANGIRSVSLEYDEELDYNDSITKDLISGSILIDSDLHPLVNLTDTSLFDLYVGEQKIDSSNPYSITTPKVEITLKFNKTGVLTDYVNDEYREKQTLTFFASGEWQYINGEIISVEPVAPIRLKTGNSYEDIAYEQFIVKTSSGEETIMSLDQLTKSNVEVSIDDGSFLPTEITDPAFYPFLIFQYVRTQSYDDLANVSVYFTYVDTTDYEEKSFTANIPVEVNGFVRAVATPINNFVPSGTIVSGGLFRVVAYDGNGQEYSLRYGNPTRTNPHVYTIEEHGTSLTTGVATLTLVVSSRQFANEINLTQQINVYNSIPYELSASGRINNYSVSQAFNYEDILAIAKYYVTDSINYETELATNQFTCNVADGYVFGINDIGHKVISISHSGVNASYTISITALQTQQMWIFNKITLERTIYGEYENNFNISMALDQTSDSTKIVVKNYDYNEIKPNTIVYLPDTNSWWVVKKDTASRYASEKSSGYWEHEIQLTSAFDILVNRDMINHGYNKDRYTLETMLNRLVSMTDFELPITFDFRYFNKDTKIGYIKAFENYAPSTAIKEILNGINAIPKMSFTFNGTYTLTGAIIKLIPKSGIGNTPININIFNIDEEVKTSSKNNYGTRVVSNIENCVSSELVRYPASGAITVSSDESEVTNENCFIKLPTNVDYIDRLEIVGSNMDFKFILGEQEYSVRVCVSSASDIENAIESAITYYHIAGTDLEIETLKNNIKEYARLNKIVTLKNESSIEHHKWNEYHLMSLYFGDKNYYYISPNPDHTIYWEQGSDKIVNFGKWFKKYLDNYVNVYDPSLVGHFIQTGGITFEVLTETSGSSRETLYFSLDLLFGFNKSPMQFAVYYRPQVSFKLKVENDEIGNDTNLFNQNGKLVDANAVAKLINSHAQDISSNEITRSLVSRNFNTMPTIGMLVLDENGVEYVINNASYDFSENDDDGFFIIGEYTMSKAVACKSTMISADNNVRDYECPQNYNIRREQLYRDYIELDYTLNSNETPLFGIIENIFNYTYKNCGDIDTYICFLKIKNSLYEDYLYFKKETTKVVMSNSRVIICDFGDNNIIGYSRAKGQQYKFDIRILFTLNKLYNIPVSYVDSVGEMNEVDISVISGNDYGNLVTDYLVEIGEEKSNADYLNYSPIINEDIYEKGELVRKSLIEEPNYNKDGLEKPIFEIIQQIGGSNGIIVGDKFFNSIECGENEYLIYQFAIQSTRVREENCPNVGSISMYQYSLYKSITAENVANISYNNSTRDLTITFKASETFRLDGGTITQSLPYGNTLLGKNIAIIVTKVVDNGDTTISKVESHLLFAINNCKVEKDSNNQIKLKVSTYKFN